MINREKNVEKAIVKYCNDNAIPVINTSGIGKGVADLVICYLGQYLEVEVKRSKNWSIGDNQEIRKNMIEDNFGNFKFCSSLDQFKEVLKGLEYGIARSVKANNSTLTGQD